MGTVTLVDLGPILAAILGPMLLFMAASMRYQHIESTRTRELITQSIDKTEQTNREMIEKANKETHKLIDKTEQTNRKMIEKANKETHKLIDRNYDLIMRNHDWVMKNSAGLADVRERLARIEGHLRISPPPEQGTDNSGDARPA